MNLEPPPDDPAGQVIAGLPLWRVQWACLPGTQARRMRAMSCSYDLLLTTAVHL